MTTARTGYDTERLDDDGGPTSPQPDGSGLDGRLVWASAPTRHGLDGAWWPRSLDAAGELVGLLPDVSGRLGALVSRVSINMEAWGPDQPPRLQVGDQTVRLEWFHTLDPATVTFGRGDRDRITLLVLPPGLDEPSARGLLHRLSITAAWPDSPAAVLTGRWTGAGGD